MNTNLTFKNTMSVAHFKQVHDVAGVEVIRNPHTNKLFWKAGEHLSGKVAEKGYQPHPAISQCIDQETGEEFMMLHAKGATNTVEVL